MTEQLTVIRLAAPIVLLVALSASPAASQSPPAEPTAVVVTPAEREAIRGEMRTILRSLSLVLHGLAGGNTEMVEEAARRSGKAFVMNPDLEKKLPPAYLQLDRRVHLRFEELANAVGGTRSTSRTATALAAISGYCVACHDIFRLDERR